MFSWELGAEWLDKGKAMQVVWSQHQVEAAHSLPVTIKLAEVILPGYVLPQDLYSTALADACLG